MLYLLSFPHQIQGWVHKASMCDFNLVVVPVHRNLSGEMKLSHPFRGATFISLSLPPEEEEKWGGLFGVIYNFFNFLLLFFLIVFFSFLPEVGPELNPLVYNELISS